MTAVHPRKDGRYIIRLSVSMREGKHISQSQSKMNAGTCIYAYLRMYGGSEKHQQQYAIGL